MTTCRAKCAWVGLLVVSLGLVAGCGGASSAGGASSGSDASEGPLLQLDNHAGPEATPMTTVDGSPVTMWSVTLEKAKPMERVVKDADEIGLVLRGTATLRLEGVGKGRTLAQWEAFRVTDGKYTLSGTGTLLMAQVTGESPQPAEAFEVVDFKAVERHSWAQRQASARIGFDDGRASFTLLESEPAIGVPIHVHDKSWEVVGMLQGDGMLVRGVEPGADANVARIPMKSGARVALPSGVKHGYEPSGGQPLFAVQLYVPPGPEQRFKQLAAKAKKQQPAP